MKHACNRRSFVKSGIAAATGAGLYANASIPSATAGEEPSDAQVVWWVAADPHVGWGVDPEHYSHGRGGANVAEDYPGQHLRKSVADVNHLGIADYAVMLGDLVADSKELAAPFVREMDRLETPFGWTYVLGNHDFDGKCGRRLGEPVLPVRYNARNVLGIRCIFLSTGRTGELVGHDQEKWFWSELETHRRTNTPIFMFTHHPHDHGLQIWPRLRKVIDDYPIVAWFSGHSHNWKLRDDSGHGFVQVTIHSIGGTRSHGPGRHDYLSSFLFLDRKGETVEATVRFRNHGTQQWIEADGRKALSFSI